MILPMEVVSIPNFLMFSDFDPLGLVSLVRAVTGLQIRINIFDNPLNCYLPAAMGVGLKNGLYILIFMQFFKGLPKEIEEAAYVDGCGFFKTMLRVMLPNAKPAVLVVVLFAVVWYWNDTSLTSLYFDQFMTVSGELLRISTDAGALLNATVATDIVTWVQAGVMLSVFPMILLYLFCQKSFVEKYRQYGTGGLIYAEKGRKEDLPNHTARKKQKETGGIIEMKKLLVCCSGAAGSGTGMRSARLCRRARSVQVARDPG